jgi:hypothetical protein
MKRFIPAVEAPYGIPRKVLTPPEVKPRTLPILVFTTGLATGVFVAGVEKLAAIDSGVTSASELRAEVLRKVRRVTAG